MLSPTVFRATRYGLLPLLLALTACGVSDDGAGSGDTAPDAPLYLAASWVSSMETTNTYIATFDSLDVEELDFSQALEIPGYGDAWVYDKWVFIADGEEPKVTRYELGADGQLKPGNSISFANYGVLGAAFWDQEILSPTKAYLSVGAAEQYVVWNPTTMEITGTLDWPTMDFGEGLEPFNSYTDRGGVVKDGYYFHGIYGHDEDFLRFGELSIVNVWDIATDELVKSIQVPCPMMDVASLGADGYLYVSGWSYMPLSYTAGYTKTNCAARIDVAKQELDESWTLDYDDVTDGEQGHALRWVEGNDAVFAVFHGSGVEVTDNMDMWDLDVAENDWELYGLDLQDRTVTPTGIKMSDGSFYESHVDGEYYVYLGGLADTQVYQRTKSGYEPRFKAAGWMSRFFKLR